MIGSGIGDAGSRFHTRFDEEDGVGTCFVAFGPGRRLRNFWGFFLRVGKTTIVMRASLLVPGI